MSLKITAQLRCWELRDSYSFIKIDWNVWCHLIETAKQLKLRAVWLVVDSMNGVITWNVSFGHEVEECVTRRWSTHAGSSMHDKSFFHLTHISRWTFLRFHFVLPFLTVCTEPEVCRSTQFYIADRIIGFVYSRWTNSHESHWKCRIYYQRFDIQMVACRRQNNKLFTSLKCRKSIMWHPNMDDNSVSSG